MASAMAAALLCGLTIYMATGGTDTSVSRKWMAVSLLAGAFAVALGVVGIEDGRRGRLACAGSALLVVGVIVFYYAAGPRRVMAI